MQRSRYSAQPHNWRSRICRASTRRPRCGSRPAYRVELHQEAFWPQRRCAREGLRLRSAHGSSTSSRRTAPCAPLHKRRVKITRPPSDTRASTATRLVTLHAGRARHSGLGCSVHASTLSYHCDATSFRQLHLAIDHLSIAAMVSSSSSRTKKRGVAAAAVGLSGATCETIHRKIRVVLGPFA